MPARRLLPAALLSAVALVGVSGCQQPTPSVTLQSGGRTVHADAVRWCFPGQSGDRCRTLSGRTPTELEVTPGQLLAVDVDKAIVDRHWFVQQSVLGAPAGQKGASGQSSVQSTHYFSFGVNDQPVLVQVVALDGGSDKTQTTGAWQFVLRPRRS